MIGSAASGTRTCDGKSINSSSYLQSAMHGGDGTGLEGGSRRKPSRPCASSQGLTSRVFSLADGSTRSQIQCVSSPLRWAPLLMWSLSKTMRRFIHGLFRADVWMNLGCSWKGVQGLHGDSGTVERHTRDGNRFSGQWIETA